MKTFAALYRRLDAATSTNHKNQALQDYLATLGSWYLIILGGLAIVLMVFAPEGVWGVTAHRFNVSLFPVRRRLIVATAAAGEPKT